MGYSATGYRSWEAPGDICDARRSILIRLVGPVAKRNDAKSVLAQKAKVGFSPCCVRATHSAVSLAFQLGA